jgi:hypothetical protein
MTDTTTYTIRRNDLALAKRGLSLEDAADECLSYDGHDWEWRENPKYAVGDEKFWEIWRSPYSRNKGGADRSLVETRFAGYDRAAILLEVVTADWSDNFDVMTDEQFDALLAEIAAEAAEEEGA